MPLNISLKPRERLVVNGAVIRNRSGQHALTIEFLNRVNFMREREILQPEQATTPLLRVIYWLQVAYIDPEQHAMAEERFLVLAQELHEAVAVPELRTAITVAITAMRQGRFGAALKKLRDALPLEQEMLGLAAQQRPPVPECIAALRDQKPAVDGLDGRVAEEPFDPRPR